MRKLRNRQSKHATRPSPFKGEAGRGMGFCVRLRLTHPHPNLPLEGEGKYPDITVLLELKLNQLHRCLTDIFQDIARRRFAPFELR
jgi:hypothetical protein